MADATDAIEPGTQSPHVRTPWDFTDRLLLAVVALAALLPRILFVRGVPFNVSESAFMLHAEASWQRLHQLLLLGADKYSPSNLRFVLVVKFWNSVAGDGEAAMRLLPLLLGFATVALGYAAARQLLDRRPALIAALLMAINPYLVVFSRTLGAEALILFLCVTATYAFLKIYTGRARSWDYALYAAALLAGLALHFITAALILPFFIAFFCTRTRRPGQVPAWLIANAPVIALCFVSTPLWRQIMIAHMGFVKDSHLMELYDTRLMNQQMIFNITFIEKYLNVFFTISGFFPGSVFHKINGFDFLALFLVIPGFHVAMFYGLREYPGGLPARVYLVFALFIAGGAGAVLSVFGYQYRVGLIPVYLIFSMILAGGVTRFGGARLRSMFAAAVVLLFLGGWASVRADEKVSADWRAVARSVQETVPVGDALFELDAWNASAFTFYLKGDRNRSLTLFDDFAPIDIAGTDQYLSGILTEPFRGEFNTYGDVIQKTLARQGTVWLVFEEGPDDDPARVEEIKRWVRTAMKSGIILVEERRFNMHGKGPRTAIHKDMDESRRPVVLLHIRLKSRLDDYFYR